MTQFKGIKASSRIVYSATLRISRFSPTVIQTLNPSFNTGLYFQEWDPQTPGLAVCTRSESEVRSWCDEVAAQRILLTTPSVLLGERLSVYRVEGTTQWYSAFIIGVNQETGVSDNDIGLI